MKCVALALIAFTAVASAEPGYGYGHGYGPQFPSVMGWRKKKLHYEV